LPCNRNLHHRAILQAAFSAKKHFEHIEYAGDLLLPLREYPVCKVLAVYTLSGMGGAGEIVEPESYSVVPDCGTIEDLLFRFPLPLNDIEIYRQLRRFIGLGIKSEMRKKSKNLPGRIIPN
jgi:hypothetical protein